MGRSEGRAEGRGAEGRGVEGRGVEGRGEGRGEGAWRGVPRGWGAARGGPMASCMRASTMLRNSLPRMVKEGDSASCHELRAHDWESGREPGAGGERRGRSDE